MDNLIPNTPHVIVDRAADREGLDLHADSLHAFSEWIDAELAKLEARFATRGTGRCPAGFYLTSRR